MLPAAYLLTPVNFQDILYQKIIVHLGGKLPHFIPFLSILGLQERNKPIKSINF